MLGDEPCGNGTESRAVLQKVRRRAGNTLDWKG